MDGFPRAKKLKEDIEGDERAACEGAQAVKYTIAKKSPPTQKNTKLLEPSTSTSNYHCEDPPRPISRSAPEPEGENNQIVPNEGLSPSISDELLSIEERLCSQLLEIKYPSPVTHVYNPLSYASQTHQSFVRRFGNNKKRILFVGMNPGPFGMAQNGVKHICIQCILQ